MATKRAIRDSLERTVRQAFLSRHSHSRLDFSAVVRMAGVALGWMTLTSALGSGQERIEVIRGLTFLDLASRSPAGADAGKEGEGAWSHRRQTRLAASFHPAKSRSLKR